LALIDNKLVGGTFSPEPLGTTPTGNMTMHFECGASGVADTRIGVGVRMPGFKDYDVFFTRDECYSLELEALQNARHIFARLIPE
jgi:hypothetical protein